jgi:hypothetical protein
MMIGERRGADIARPRSRCAGSASRSLTITQIAFPRAPALQSKEWERSPITRSVARLISRLRVAENGASRGWRASAAMPPIVRVRAATGARSRRPPGAKPTGSARGSLRRRDSCLEIISRVSLCPRAHTISCGAGSVDEPSAPPVPMVTRRACPTLLGGRAIVRAPLASGRGAHSFGEVGCPPSASSRRASPPRLAAARDERFGWLASPLPPTTSRLDLAEPYRLLRSIRGLWADKPAADG